MIEKNAETGELEVICTKCGEAGSFGVYETYKELTFEMKKVGWKVYKEGDEWCHSCPTCFEEWKNEKYSGKKPEKRTTKDQGQLQFDFMKQPQRKKSDVPF